MTPSPTPLASSQKPEFLTLAVVAFLDPTCPSLVLNFNEAFSGRSIGCFPIALGPSVYNVRIDDQSFYGIGFKEPADAQAWYSEQSQNKHFGSLFQYSDPTRHTVWISRQMSWTELRGKLPRGLPDSSSDGVTRPPWFGHVHEGTNSWRSHPFAPRRPLPQSYPDRSKGRSPPSDSTDSSDGGDRHYDDRGGYASAPVNLAQKGVQWLKDHTGEKGKASLQRD